MREWQSIGRRWESHFRGCENMFKLRVYMYIKNSNGWTHFFEKLPSAQFGSIRKEWAFIIIFHFICSIISPIQSQRNEVKMFEWVHMFILNYAHIFLNDRIILNFNPNPSKGANKMNLCSFLLLKYALMNVEKRTHFTIPVSLDGWWIN